jgi:GNAT superfamily N-acetyltransferase
MAVVDSLHYARPDEVHALEELQRRASTAWDGYEEPPAESPDAIRISVAAVRDQRVRVAVGAGAILGFSIVLPLERTVSRLASLFVEPAWSGRGVGAALLEDAEAIAADEGIVRLEVVSNPVGAGFFEHAGFVTVETVEAWFGPAVRMAREL